ncbi:protein NO VEIN domain-containing protein [Lysinibacillus sp. JNUCC-52]|uniref:protein NO VEIN domain-containing protein n=1 Tax=Lysinibacillus sp. JNUCC-52 TaxID=2792480 RepID=UPI001938CA9C|nr:DUF3883 domain-containing protein [Lysinibacillus sp. JNUCC-52]
MKSFIVMQNKTYREELNGGYIWSPQKNKAGNKNHGYERMKEVKKGDRIFSCYNQAIQAVGIAIVDCYESPKPQEFNNQKWEVKGFRVDIEYSILENPIKISDVWENMKPYKPAKYYAFKENGSGVEAYLFPCPVEWSNIFERESNFITQEVEVEEVDVEAIIDGEIVEEIMAISSFKKGKEKVRNRMSSSREKGNRVSSQDEIQRDLKKRKEIGDIAEEKVYTYVQKKVEEVFGKEYLEKVEHVAKTQGDGLGYDITAFDYRNPSNPPRPIKIEVKGTTLTDKRVPYFISYSELEKFIKHKENIWVIRVFGVTKQERLVIEIDDSFEQYESAADLLERKYAYIPSIIEVFGVKVEEEQ